VPMRELVNALMRRDLHVVDDAMTPYYQDVYDHVLRATEWTESLRDLVTTILETNMTIQGNRLNSIMKKVTSWAAIIACRPPLPGSTARTCRTPGSGTLGVLGVDGPDHHDLVDPVRRLPVAGLALNRPLNRP